MVRVSLLITATVLAICAIGCKPGPQVAPVSGKVTYNGQPLPFGSVMLQLKQGGQPAVGEIQPDGSFTLTTFAPGDGAIVGEHRVRVACYSSQDPAVRAKNPGGSDSLGTLLIPMKYTILGGGGLDMAVPPEGKSDVLFELKGPPFPKR